MEFNEIDKRNFSKNRATPDRQKKLNLKAEEISKKLPDTHKIKIKQFDRTTGNFAEIISESAPIPEDQAEKTSYVKRAEQYLHTLSPALGFASNQTVEFKMDPVVPITSANTKVVHGQQTFLSKDIFQSGTSVSFDANDSVKGVTGNIITIDQSLDAIPKLSAKNAVMITAKFLSNHQLEGQKDPFGEPLGFEKLNLQGFEPEVDVVIEDPSMTTFFKPGPFAERTKARLLWFELEPNDLRLSWEITTTQKNSMQYRTIVDATKTIADIGEEQDTILYNKLLTKFLKSQINGYTVNGGNGRINVDCPINGQRDDWNDDNPITNGNSTFAHLGTSPTVCHGNIQNNKILFNPDNPTGDDQKVLNIFYYCCYMHDFFYDLGFREVDGNFQHDNFGRGGLGGDKVDARAHSGPVQGTANMSTRIDGRSPIMNMGLVTRTNLHTAFDSDVVFHEFMHGVTNRLVGGPQDASALESPQSGGMGEGWGDYVACTINKKNVVGDWVVDNPRGIRHNKYDSNFPHNFGDLGKTVGGVTYNEVHNIGELWCATLLEMNRNINDNTLSMQLVVDALKLSPTNPSFLNMRDSILQSLDDKLTTDQISSTIHNQVKKAIWKAFAKFGMGPNASSNGAQLSGIIADFNEP
jgi:extracellular elastinolytic metalloproteinase